MKNVTAVAMGSVAGAALVGVVAFAAGQADQKVSGPAAMVVRYAGVAEVPIRAGTAPARLRVEMRDWHFVRTEQGVKLPIVGFYIAQLTSGEIDTEIDGKREHRVAGDFWTVPVGGSMTLSFPPHSQAAQIRTMAVAPGARTR